MGSLGRLTISIVINYNIIYGALYCKTNFPVAFLTTAQFEANWFSFKITEMASIDSCMTGTFVFLIKCNPLKIVPITDPRWRPVHGHRPFLPAHNIHNVSFVVSLFSLHCNLYIASALSLGWLCTFLLVCKCLEWPGFL